MALQVQSRSPNFRVVFYLKSNGIQTPSTIDTAATDTLGSALRRSVVSITTQRRLGQAGTFEITLLPDATGQWQDAISPMDYVEIYMTGSPAGATAIPIRFRGFVDSATYSFSIAGGVPRPVVIIAGRDFTKIPLEQRFYPMGDTLPALAPINAFTQALAKLHPVSQSSVPTSTEISKAANSTQSSLAPDQVMAVLFIVTLLPFFTSIFQNLGITAIPIQLDASLAATDAAALSLQAISPPILSDNYDAIAARIWQIMTEYSNAPFYELFFEDYDTAQYLVFRPAPWRDAHQNFISGVYTSLLSTYGLANTYAPEPALITISPDEIETITLARTDAYGAVANFFITYASVFATLTYAQARITSATGLTATSNPSILGSPPTFSTPADLPSDWRNFGFRPLDVSTKYIPFGQYDSKTALSAAQQKAQGIALALNNRLTAAFSYGEFLESGMITLIRDPQQDSANPIHLGDYVSLSPTLSHSFGSDLSSQTSLTGDGSFAYVELISYEMVVPLNQTNGSYRIRLGVTRGEGYLNRHAAARKLAPTITISSPSTP